MNNDDASKQVIDAALIEQVIDDALQIITVEMYTRVRIEGGTLTPDERGRILDRMTDDAIRDIRDAL